MSIPPLVCSTPPPPEQCEDDKDPEDFDLSYNLSQEEDDDSTEYNFVNYPSYNIYQTKSDNVDTEKWPSHFNETVECKQEDSIQSKDITRNVNFITTDNLFTEDIPKFEENILEDLNLKIEADDVHSNGICTKEDETEPKIYDTEESSGVCNTRIQDQGGTNIIKNEEENITIEDTPEIVESVSNCDNNEHVNNENNEEIIQYVYDELTVSCENKSTNTLSDNEQSTSSSNMISELASEEAKDQAEHFNDDEFGDFEDFQFKSSIYNKVLPLSSENPWDSNTNESLEFGAFTAKFDSSVQELDEISNSQNDNKNDSAINDDKDDDDDFGDFDDFKSSSNIPEGTEEAKNVTATSNLPVLNFHSQDNESQIVDTLNNVLTTIFINEISEPDNNLDDKLELYLSETWGHLINIDVRQPYMVNWNNSLGQKTLLKALCIDSRNILFGHKWNYNMPKYAANLSVAPLQPQKQQAHSVAPNTETVEKAASKESTWVDPFTPDGQESCNTETEGTKVDTVKRPTDLDVFENETSTKLNKIYSSTLNVQPLRHINLPDTHIFTPTDSETPRSKTIHYDDGPALVPAPVIETDKNEPEQLVQEPSNMESDNEYWEFQDFKGMNTQVPVLNAADQEKPEEAAAMSTSDSLPKGGITYQTQILQPIKIEPIMPTLNWPDPGEVKETFDDFSDFISSTSWSNDKYNSVHDLQKEDTKVEDNKNNIKTEKIDDEFETFQSAPAPTSVVEFDVSASLNRNLEHSSMKIIANNDKVEMSHTKKLNEIPTEIPTSTMQNNVLGLQDFNFPQPSGLNPMNYQANSNILQPTSSSTSETARTQHTTGQILQPLSLESYSQINWPNPGIDLQDLSRFNPVNSLHSLKSEAITGGNSKSASPARNSVHSQNDIADDDIWGDFVSSTPKPQTSPKKPITFVDDDEWTDFVSSPSIRPQNGLNTISLNVHTNLSMQKPSSHNKILTRSNQLPLDIPTLNYITPKSNNRVIYTEKHFQNL
ncbi:unnamed protein product, partial [Brenthis ino]